MKLKGIKLFWIYMFIAIITAMALLDIYIHDFRTVIPNQVYRSRQLSGQQLIKTVDEYRLKSILNLRGAHPGDDWYNHEVNVSKQNHIQHYNISLDSNTLPTPSQFRKLVHIIGTAPRPLLVHCESGVDRSGLASAISILLANGSLQHAKRQVSWHYFVFKHESTGKQFFRSYDAWLTKHKIEKSSREHFLQWLSQYR